MALVEFDSVSKRYRIGLSQANLPHFVAGLARRVFTRQGRQQAAAQVLWALRDLSFQIHEGESLALVGANGAGKTTVLRLLANITKPTTGRVDVHGRLSALIELGAGFHPDLTGRDNTFLNGAILGISRRELSKRFDEIVDFSGLAPFIDTPVKRYSPGMITRLGFAVAACVEPRVLLVDEVLAVGDAVFSQKCLERIELLRRGGTAIVFVSHNLYLVKSVCARGVYLRKGELRFEGAASDVIRAYERDLHEERAQRTTSGHQDQSTYARPVAITSVELLDGEGRMPGHRFLSHDAARIVVRFHASVRLRAANLALVIRRADGGACGMIRSRDHDATFTIDPGDAEITVRLDPLQLVSGTYFVDARITDGADAVDISAGSAQSDWFAVTGIGLSHEEQVGVFEPRATFLVSAHEPGVRTTVTQ